MRYLILFSLVVILISVFPTTGKAFDESLVLFFPFEENQGDTTEDKSGHDNTGALVNDPEWVEGKYGRGLLLGNGSYVNVSDSETLDGVSELTIELWLYVNQNNSAILAAKNNWNTSFHSHLWGGDVIFWGFDGGNDRTSTSPGTLVVGEWAHFALQFDGPGSMWRIYKNGGEVAASPAMIKEIPDTDLNFSIGGRDSGGASIDGIIDEVAVYNRALSQEEIGRDMEGIATAVGPVGRLATTWARIKKENGNRLL